MWRLLWLALALFALLVNYVRCPEPPLNLDLLEQLLTKLGRGGSAIDVARLSRAIITETTGAPQAVREIAQIRHGTSFERDLSSWAQRQDFTECFPDLYKFSMLKHTMKDGVPTTAECPPLLHPTARTICDDFSLFPGVVQAPVWRR